MAINVSGKVAVDGAVTVIVSHGETRGGLRPARGQCRRRLLEDHVLLGFAGPPSGDRNSAIVDNITQNVMAGLNPAIHDFTQQNLDVDARGYARA